MHQRTRRRAGKKVADHHAAVLRNEHVVQYERLTAGASETEHLPVIDDLDIGERRQQIRNVSGITRLAEERTEDRPLRVIAAAGKWKPPTQTPASAYSSSGRPRRKRGRGDCFGVIAPDVDL